VSLYVVPTKAPIAHRPLPAVLRWFYRAAVSGRKGTIIDVIA